MNLKTLLLCLAAPLALTLPSALAIAQTSPAASAQTGLEGPDWRLPDPENLMVITTTKGRVVVEMFPDVAPLHVQQLKTLTRQNFYDGIVFHRVIEGFMAQTGDPLGTGEGNSELPDIAGEFQWRRSPQAQRVAVGAMQGGAAIGFLNQLPVVTQPDSLALVTKDKKVWTWGLHCPGVASMARSDDPNSANSQFFLMRAAYPALDKRYSIWGRLIEGQDVVLALKVGEPVVDPDKMISVRMAADLPPAERPRLLVQRTDGPAFGQKLAQARASMGAEFAVCDIAVETKSY